jgi:putative transcriptional regulator
LSTKECGFTFNSRKIKAVVCIIVFDRLWDTMRKKNISQYKLIKDYKISTGQLDRLRKNENVNTYTLNQLCEILNCELEDIAQYKS